MGTEKNNIKRKWIDNMKKNYKDTKKESLRAAIKIVPICKKQ